MTLAPSVNLAPPSAPTVLAISPKKGRFAQLLGAFTEQSVSNFITGVLSGRERIGPYSEMPSVSADDDCALAHGTLADEPLEDDPEADAIMSCVMAGVGALCRASLFSATLTPAAPGNLAFHVDRELLEEQNERDEEDKAGAQAASDAQDAEAAATAAAEAAEQEAKRKIAMAELERLNKKSNVRHLRRVRMLAPLSLPSCPLSLRVVHLCIPFVLKLKHRAPFPNAEEEEQEEEEQEEEGQKGQGRALSAAVHAWHLIRQ